MQQLIHEAERQFEICNACRYCEGYCAVFPAIERRGTFERGDIFHLANLCHDCRNCYTACMYAPPHEFAVNIPALMSEIRLEVYQEYTSPLVLRNAFKSQQMVIAATLVLSVLVMLVLAILINGPRHLLTLHRGAGAFYTVIPYFVMLVPALILSLYVVIMLASSLKRYWQDIQGRQPEVSSLIVAGWQALTLRWLYGGGRGCDYPSSHGSFIRPILHSLVFYGFMSAFIATILAAVYQDVLGILPPYPVLSAPVLCGIIGGIGLILGTTGMLYYKIRSDMAPSYPRMVITDYMFIILLDLVSITGMLTLILRNTQLMGIILATHLGFVLGLFITAPYGKFVHFIYRYTSLIKNYLEVLGNIDHIPQ